MYSFSGVKSTSGFRPRKSSTSFSQPSSAASMSVENSRRFFEVFLRFVSKSFPNDSPEAFETTESRDSKESRSLDWIEVRFVIRRCCFFKG